MQFSMEVAETKLEQFSSAELVVSSGSDVDKLAEMLLAKVLEGIS